MKLNFFISLLLLLVLSTVSYAVPISDPKNPHNMSNLATHSGPKAADNPSGGTDQICVFCHTPHSAAPQTPLWNRPDPATLNFPVYGATLEIGRTAAARTLTGYDANDPDYPSGTSRMCLSCHDGATSIGVLLNGVPVTMESGSDFIVNDGDPANIQGVIDLSTSHPISFKYNNAVVTTLLEPSKPSAYQLPLGIIDVPLDAAERMQCTTCHDPHEDTSDDVTYDNLPFWRHQGDGTSYVDVCNDCHTAPTVASPPLPPTSHN